MVGAVLVALFALPGTAFADFNVLGSWTATTSLGQTCTMQVLGGSNSHPSLWGAAPLTPLSEIDWGIVLDCPTGTLQSSADFAWMQPANPNDPTAPNDYIQYTITHTFNPNAPRGGGVGCNSYDQQHPYWPDYCYQTARYTGGSPNHQYQISGTFDLNTLYQQASWSSYPSICHTYQSAPWHLWCGTPTFVVTGYSGP
jgi:hypothetical protein